MENSLTIEHYLRKAARQEVSKSNQMLRQKLFVEGRALEKNYHAVMVKVKAIDNEQVNRECLFELKGMLKQYVNIRAALSPTIGSDILTKDLTGFLSNVNRMLSQKAEKSTAEGDA